MMNRGLGSIMGYRGGGMPVARFQAGGRADQAERDRVILEYTQAVYAQPGITTEAAAAQIAAAMDQYGVSPQEFSGAFQRDTATTTPEQRAVFGNQDVVRQAYEAVRPTGQYSASAEADRIARETAAREAAARETAARETAAREAAARAEADRIARENQQSLAEDYSTKFFDALRAGDRQTALSILSRAQADFPESDLFNIAAANLPSAGLSQDLFKTISGADDIATADELRSYITGTGTGTDTVIDTSTKGREDLTGGTTFTDAGNVRTDTTIPGVPGFTRQQASGFSFAPVQRGLGQLRGPAYMPGLLQGTEGFGGTGLSQKQVLAGIQPYAQRIERGAEPGLAIQDYILNEMIPQGLSPAEVAAASPTLSLGATQQYYNQFAPQGVFSTAAPRRTVLPEDFVLQTGAYTTPVIPSNIPLSTTGNTTASPTGTNQPTYNELLDNVKRLGAEVEALQNPEDSSPGRSGGAVKNNKIIKMAEGGEPPPMSKLDTLDLGSTFDISKYIDDEGRLVGGYSRPIYDENRVITGYDYRPYERDVVFGKELREKEAAMRLTDAEREQMMVEMAMRQGRTGISPTRGGLAGIEIGDPMMRRRPQYYSTVEESRPRYAEGGLASVAQNLADKGRKGDSMLVHMTPDEVAGLQALAQQMGGSLTINPQTGLPEANIFKKLLPMALGFALGPAGFGVFQSALTAGLAVGAGYTLATGSLQQGLSAGLSAYGGSNLGTGLQAAGAEAATSAAASEAAGSGLQVAGGAGGAAAEAAMANPMAHPDFGGSIVTGGPSTTPINLGGATSGSMGMEIEPFMQGDPGVSPTFDSTKLLPVSQQPAAYGTSTAPPTPPPPGSAITGAERSLLGDKATRDLAAERYAAETGSTLGTSAMQIAGGMAGQSAADAEATMRAQQAAIDAKREERERRFEELARRTLGRVNVKSGGQINLAKGGMTYMEAGGTTDVTGEPRMVQGTGDGMSDSVPATIEGVQEARLANDEFVIPADVVADIGNGSSNAGAKKLYDMMDRIRKARHNTTEQPPEIRAERLMPA